MKRRIFAIVLIICLLFTSTALGAVEKPGKVKNLKIKSDFPTITISFDKVKDATGYKIYYSEDEDFGYKSRLSYSTKSTIVLDTGKTYYFKVRAFKTVNGKNYYGPYSEIAMGTVRKSDPFFYTAAQNDEYSNDVLFYVASYKDVSYPVTVDLYSFMLYDEFGSLIAPFKPTYYVCAESTSTTVPTWKPVDVTTFRPVNNDLLGIALKAQYGYTKPDLSKHTIVYTGEYNGKKYLFKTTNGKTDFCRLNWKPTVENTN